MKPSRWSTVNKQAEIVARGANRIEHIVADLLDLSRVREGLGITVDPTPIDLRATCQRIIDELGVIAHDRQIALDCNTDGRGTWDEHRILQAISNLASNARQHGTPGSAYTCTLLAMRTVDYPCRDTGAQRRSRPN